MDTVVPARIRQWLLQSARMRMWMLTTVKAAAASALAAAAAAALAPLWERQHVKYSFPYDPTPTGAEEPLSTTLYRRTTLHFDSQGERCEAWLYLPTASAAARGTDSGVSCPPAATPATPATQATAATTPTSTQDAAVATGPSPQSATAAHLPLLPAATATTGSSGSTTPCTTPSRTHTTPPAPQPDSAHPATVAHLPSGPDEARRGPSAPEVLPETTGPLPRVAGTPLPPVVLMAHGLGAQKDMGLHRYAHQFAEAGFAVLVFDYRGFGGSGGQERHVGTPGRYLEDWEAAMQFLTMELASQVDTSRITLWGTSYSGGHVLLLAARHATRVRCAISQEPFLSARAIALPNIRRRGLVKVARAMLVALHDSLRGAAGLCPAYIKAVGQQHELALLEVTDEEYQTFLANPNPAPAVRQGGWSNLMAARSGLAILRYNPIDWLPRVRCPVLFVAGSKDYLCPPDLIERAFRRAPGGSELVVKSANHFELFRGMYVEADVIPEMVRFAAQHSTTAATADSAG